MKRTDKCYAACFTCGDVATALASGTGDAVTPSEFHIREFGNVFLPIPAVQKITLIFCWPLRGEATGPQRLPRPHENLKYPATAEEAIQELTPK